MQVLAIFIKYLIIIIWLFPPFQQYRTKYFLFFLTLLITEFSNILLQIIFKFPSALIYLIGSYLILLCLLDRVLIKRIWYLLFLLLIIILYSFFTYKNQSLDISFLILLHLIIFLRLSFLFISEIGQRNNIKIFLIVFLLYESTIILKFMYVILGFTFAYSYFLITSIFEIIFGLFFSLFKEDNPRIVIRLKQEY